MIGDNMTYYFTDFYNTPQSGSVRVWAVEAWTVENNVSPNVDVFDLDYKRTDKHIYI